MCLIVFASQATGRYRLVVAANRDEFYARRTGPAGWSDDGRRLSGRDLRGGGTWMGVTRDGRFAALTNHRDPQAVRPDAPSRGLLCDRVLADARAPVKALATIAADAAPFNGFNLLAGRWSADGRSVDLHVLANDASAPSSIASGVHGLSNARLDTPWPKVDRAREGLRAALRDEPDADLLVARLFGLLADRRTADDADLPATGVALATERALSAACIRLPDYGTRSSTVLLVDDHGHVTFVERRCEPGAPTADVRHAFATLAPTAARAS